MARTNQRCTSAEMPEGAWRMHGGAVNARFLKTRDFLPTVFRVLDVPHSNALVFFTPPIRRCRASSFFHSVEQCTKSDPDNLGIPEPGQVVQLGQNLPVGVCEADCCLQQTRLDDFRGLCVGYIKKRLAHVWRMHGAL